MNTKLSAHKNEGFSIAKIMVRKRIQMHQCGKQRIITSTNILRSTTKEIQSDLNQIHR